MGFLLLACLPIAIALVTFRDYGESVDDGPLYNYSENALEAYHGFLITGLNPDLGTGHFRYYGPAFLMAANLFVRTVNALTGNLSVEAWHLTYFLAFYACAIGLYFLSVRWFSKFTAFAISALFLFQPMLWGQGFINSKDIPFMSFFAWSILTGVVMLEKVFPIPINWEDCGLTLRIGRLEKEWQQSSVGDRRMVITIFIASILSTAIWFAGRNTLKIPEAVLASALLLILVLVLLYYLKRIFPGTLGFLNTKSLIESASTIFTNLRNPHVLIFGVVLGLTTSVRILGPLAGLIVFALSVTRAGKRSLPVMVASFILAALVMYLTWPYLWPDPIGRFDKSLAIMSEFPWDGNVLFNGTFYKANQLPWTYIPVLIGLQFTEPLVALLLGGIILFIVQMVKRTIQVGLVLLILSWGILPILLFIIFHPPLYDNLRQLLFLIPPFFLLVGFSIEKLFTYLRKWYFKFALLILLLAPGILSIIQLHPYEYVYYNSLAGGPSGAFRRYEADYWAISFREATKYLDKVAPLNSRVVVFAPGSITGVTRYARPDLVIDASNRTHFDPVTGYDYAIINTRGNRDLTNLANWQTIYTVERDGAVLTLVKEQTPHSP